MQLKTAYLILSVFLLTFSTELSAQSQITGTVRDVETNEPLVGVSIAIKETQHGTITDGDGKYNLSVHHGKCTVIFSYISHETVTKSVVCTHEKPKQVLNIFLTPSAIKIGELTVTAKSVARQIREKAMPISVITMNQLQGTVSDLNDVLSKTSGVKIRSSGGVGSSARISVRGLEGKRIGFFIDETPLSDNSDFISINDIPVDIIERIEIYKGIVPAKLGGSAVGGAVNIVLKEYPPKYLDASYSLQSFNTHKALAVFKRNKNDVEIGCGGFYTYSDNNYQMQTPEEYGEYTVIRDHDAYEKIGMAASVTSKKWWFDEIELEQIVTFTEKEIQGIEYNIQEANSNSKAYVSGLHFEKDSFLIEGLDFSLNNNYFYTQYKFNDNSMYSYNWDGSIKDTNYITELGIGEGEIGDQPNETDILKHNYHQKLNLNYVLNAKNSINFNSVYRYVKVMPDDPLKDAVIGYETDFTSIMNSWVGGLAYEFNSLNKKFSCLLTGRYYYYSLQSKIVDILDETHTPSDIDNTKQDFGVSLALRHRFTPYFLIKSSISYDVRLPTDDELIGDGFLIAPAGNLNPERNTSFNLGFMYDVSNEKQNRFQFEINGFYMALQDMIRFTGGLLQSKYQNFGEMRTLGVEVEIKADVTRWLYVWGNATYQDLRDTREYEAGSTSPNPTYMDRMPNIPYLFANAGIELHKENFFGGNGQNTRLFTDCSFVEEYFYDFEQSKHQERRIPLELTFNAGIEHSLKNQRVFLSIQANNLTDAKVLSEFNRPLPGRNFGMKLRYIWK